MKNLNEMIDISKGYVTKAMDKWEDFLENEPLAKPLNILWNYFDMGLGVGTGLAWTPYGVEVYGERGGTSGNGIRSNIAPGCTSIAKTGKRRY